MFPCFHWQSPFQGHCLNAPLPASNPVMGLSTSNGTFMQFEIKEAKPKHYKIGKSYNITRNITANPSIKTLPNRRSYSVWTSA